MDEHFAAFLEEFGLPIETRLVPQSSIERYRGQLPERLLEYWAEHGWAGYGDGLLWTVDPQEYEPVLNAWIGDTQFLQQDKYHIIARNAFGELYFWGENTGNSLTVETFDSMAYPSEGKAQYIAGRSNDAMSVFFSGKSRENYDVEDDEERLLFARALKKLGKLKHDEMYGFVPAIALGGAVLLENLEKVKAIPHLMLLAQLAPLRVSESPFP